MVRLDRAAVIAIAVALMLGFAIWQLVSSIGYTAADLLVDSWEDESTFGPFNAEFTIGGVDVAYGQVLQAGISLLVALVIALPLIRYARRRDVPEPPE